VDKVERVRKEGFVCLLACLLVELARSEELDWIYRMATTANHPPPSPRDLFNKTDSVGLTKASDSIPLSGSGSWGSTNGLPALSSESFSTGSVGYQPLYFSKDVFNSPHFNVDEFIADCRMRTPHNDLAELQKDIQSYEASLDNELIELINKDYADFVNLSAKLFGIDKTIETLRAPLDKLSREVSVSSGGCYSSRFFC